MKNNLEEIDQLIKETLSIEEAAFYDALDKQNIADMFLGLFKGKNAWILVIMNIVIIACLPVFVYCCYQVVTLDTTLEVVRWGLGSLFCLIILSMLKIYAWMQMDKNALLREMKRLELLVMSISGKK